MFDVFYVFGFFCIGVGIVKVEVGFIVVLLSNFEIDCYSFGMFDM